MIQFKQYILAIMLISCSFIEAMEERPQIQTNKRKRLEQKQDYKKQISKKAKNFDNSKDHGQPNGLFTLSSLNYVWLLENIFKNEADFVEWVNRNKELARASINSWTILNAAVESGLIPLVKHLVTEQGADINSESFNGYTPIYFAILNNRLKMVKLLLELGADVNVSKGKYGNTPLHVAAKEGNPEIIKLLLDKNADTNSLNKNGKIPLDIAIDNNCIEAVIILYDYNHVTDEMNLNSGLFDEKLCTYIAFKAMLNNDTNSLIAIVELYFLDTQKLFKLIRSAIEYNVNEETTCLLVDYFFKSASRNLDFNFINELIGLYKLAIVKKYNPFIKIINERYPNLISNSKTRFILLKTAIIAHNNEMTKLLANKEMASYEPNIEPYKTALETAAIRINIYATKLLIDLKATTMMNRGKSIFDSYLLDIQDPKYICILHLLRQYKLDLEKEENDLKALKDQAASKIKKACKTFLNNRPCCAICLESRPNSKTQCNHSFHSECVSKWFESNNHCPVCRAQCIKENTEQN